MAGFTDIIHIEVEKNFIKLSNCVKMIYTDVRKKKKRITLKLNHKTTDLQMKMPNSQSSDEIGFL